MKKYIKIMLASATCALLSLSLIFSSSALLTGDVDFDGEISASDARLILRHAAKLDILTGDALRAADINGDGTVDSADARLILRHVAKLELLKTDDGENVINDDYTNENKTAGETAAAGANDFAFRLSSALLKNDGLAGEAGNNNFICSPYSVWLPLAALANATNESSKAALLSAIGAAGVDESDLNKAASRMLYDLTNRRGKDSAAEMNEEFHDPLKIANAVFVDNDATLKESFLMTFKAFYLGNAMNVDFRSPEAVETVNKWARDNTEGLIESIIEEFDPDTVAAIANAIYFSDRWSGEFDPDNTKEDVFRSPAGDTKAFYMQREGNGQRYYEDEKIQATPLGFKTGGGMYIILPKDGDASSLLESMTSGYFKEIKNNSVYAAVKLLLPRFSIESEVMTLNDTLIKLGVPLFNKYADPLTGLLEGDIPLYISSAVQKAVIEVDEKGTTAAAVTVMVMAPTSAPPAPAEKFEMICDRPFVFILYGNTRDGGDQILFTGVVNNP
ncbi:MAG: dockerin type I domain-containing protein [Oscillospiraceae bacterium]|nr:dockerin type I domain-containing protein [Oscillospiraceae bacterium]